MTCQNEQQKNSTREIKCLEAQKYHGVLHRRVDMENIIVRIILLVSSELFISVLHCCLVIDINKSQTQLSLSVA